MPLMTLDTFYTVFRRKLFPLCQLVSQPGR